VIHFVITRGIRSAGILNAVVTLAKLIPLALIVVLGLSIFKPSLFFVPNWGNILASTGKPTTAFSQISGAMGTILWCFVGIEAAVVLSERAESQRIVGKAIVISICITLGIYILISTLAMGIIPAKQLLNSTTPLAEVLGSTFLGSVGSVIVKLGLITSISGATLSWVMLAAETPYTAAKDRVMPHWFAKENERNVPINSLFLTNILTQIFLLSIFSERLQSAYYTLYYIATTTILLPYLFSSLYALKVSLENKSARGNMLISAIASIYAIYVIYAVGLIYLALTIIMYSIGVLPYYIAKRERGEKFTIFEIFAAIVLFLLSIVMIYQIASGKIVP
jgi:arginine:ornithine antiporter/lysine permease